MGVGRCGNGASAELKVEPIRVKGVEVKGES